MSTKLGLRIGTDSLTDRVESMAAESVPGKKRWIRWGLIICTLALVLMAVLLGLGWGHRAELVRPYIDDALRARVGDAFSYRIVSLDLTEAVVEDLRIGPPDAPTLFVTVAQVRYSLPDLLAGEVRDVDLTGMRVAFSVDEQGLNFGALAPFVAGDGGQGGTVPATTLHDATLSIADATGVYEIRASGTVLPVGDQLQFALAGGCATLATSDLAIGALTLKAFETDVCLGEVPLAEPSITGPIVLTFGDLVLDVQDETGTTRLVASIPGLQINADFTAFRADVEVRDTSIFLPAEALHLGGIAGKLALDFSEAPFGGSWRLETMEVTDRAALPRFAPVILQGDGSADLNVVEFDLLVVDAGSRSLLASMKGRHSLPAGTGSANFLAGPLLFSPGGLQPQALVPSLKGLLTNVSGSADGRGVLQWRAAELGGSGTFSLFDVGLSTAAARVSGINGTLEFSQLIPLRTAGAQRVDIGLVDAGFALTDGRATFSTGADGAIRVEEAVWPFAGGHISLASGQITPGEREYAFDLSVDGVDLGTFIRVFNLDGASGSGTVHGTVPIVIRDGDPIIQGGLLRTEGPGILSYQNAGTDAVDGGQSSLVFQALRDFHYTDLSLSLDGNAQDRLTVQLNLKGANPDLYDGYPFVINVNTEASFAELLRSGTVGMRALEVIEADRNRNDGG